MHTISARTFFALTLAAALSACRPASHAPSGETTSVGRAQLYRTGQPAYDRYFDAVYQLQLEVARVPAERRASRAELAHALGLLPDAPSPRVVETMHERAADVGKGGHWFRVEGYRATTEGKDPESSVRSVGQALDACLRAEASAVDRLRQVPGRARALWDLTRTVEMGIDADFFGFRRKEVRSEVAAVRRVLRALSNEGTEQMLEGEKFVLDLTAAVSPGTAAPARPGDPEVVEKKRGPGGVKRAAGSGPAPEPAAPGEPAAGRQAARPPARRPVAAERPAGANRPAVERPLPSKPAARPAGKPSGDDFNP